MAKSLLSLENERSAFLQRIAPEDYVLTDDDRTEMTRIGAEIDEARSIEAFRASAVPAGVQVDDATPAVRVSPTATPEERVAAVIDGLIARGAKADDRIVVRAALTTSSLFGGTANPTKDDRGFKATTEKPLTFLDLFPSTSTNEDLISYIQEVVKPNTAAEAAEGTAKTEADYELEEKTHGFSIIANHITVTRQALRSRSMLQSAIENRLTANVRARANKQVYVGNGTGANIKGLRNAGIRTATMGATEKFATKGEAVYRTVKRGKRLAAESLVAPTHAVVHPENAESLEAFLELASGRYSTGLTVVESADQPVDTVLVGALTDPAVLEIIYRDGMEVYVSREHDKNLTSNLVTILGEQEAGLAVYKPDAVVEVSVAGVLAAA